MAAAHTQSTEPILLHRSVHRSDSCPGDHVTGNKSEKNLFNDALTHLGVIISNCTHTYHRTLRNHSANTQRQQRKNVQHSIPSRKTKQRRIQAFTFSFHQLLWWCLQPRGTIRIAYHPIINDSLRRRAQSIAHITRDQSQLPKPIAKA